MTGSVRLFLDTTFVHAIRDKPAHSILRREARRLLDQLVEAADNEECGQAAKTRGEIKGIGAASRGKGLQKPARAFAGSSASPNASQEFALRWNDYC